MDYESYNRAPSGWASFALFLLGLGSETKFYFYGCLAFSEAAVFVIGPFVFFHEWRNMRRDGFFSFIWWSTAVLGAMLLSATVNHTPLPYIIKSVAVIYAVVCYFFVLYTLLKKNMKGLGWLIFGTVVSGMIITFAFNPTADVSEYGSVSIGQAEIEDVINGPLYWIQRVGSFTTLPIFAAYLKTPLIYSLLVPIAFMAFSLLVSTSGRSAALTAVLGSAMILLGRKSRRTMRSIGRHIGLVAILGVVVIGGYMLTYTYAAESGLLGEEAQKKFEDQTRGGEGGILQLLMSGRKEFFIAIPAALDRPIIGHGPFAVDTKGYTIGYLVKHGEESDLAAYQYQKARAALAGIELRIPTHSRIMGAWVHYGIVGLLFYLWILYLIYRHIKDYSAAIPQWYGYFSILIPSTLWHTFFSPFGSRLPFALLISCLFFAKAVGKGELRLPTYMEMEARKYD